MKRYEKMGIDPTTEEGIEHILSIRFERRRIVGVLPPSDVATENKEIARWLCEEMPTVWKRRCDVYALDELDKMMNEHCQTSNCTTCQYSSSTGRCSWKFILEEVEVNR